MLYNLYLEYLWQACARYVFMIACSCVLLTLHFPEHGANVQQCWEFRVSPLAVVTHSGHLSSVISHMEICSFPVQGSMQSEKLSTVDVQLVVREWLHHPEDQPFWDLFTDIFFFRFQLMLHYSWPVITHYTCCNMQQENLTVTYYRCN